MRKDKIAELVAGRRRRLWTGSAESAVHDMTDEALEAIVAGTVPVPTHGGYLDADRVVSAAGYELAWRREQGIRFGWSSR
jgi:hypothetical protein